MLASDDAPPPPVETAVIPPPADPIGLPPLAWDSPAPDEDEDDWPPRLPDEAEAAPLPEDAADAVWQAAARPPAPLRLGEDLRVAEATQDVAAMAAPEAGGECVSQDADSASPEAAHDAHVARYPDAPAPLVPTFRSARRPPLPFAQAVDPVARRLDHLTPTGLDDAPVDHIAAQPTPGDLSEVWPAYDTAAVNADRDAPDLNDPTGAEADNATLICTAADHQPEPMPKHMDATPGPDQPLVEGLHPDPLPVDPAPPGDDVEAAALPNTHQPQAPAPRADLSDVRDEPTRTTPPVAASQGQIAAWASALQTALASALKAALADRTLDAPGHGCDAADPAHDIIALLRAVIRDELAAAPIQIVFRR
ncbi:hypothetical protein ACEYYA_11150 [Paracoccus sp. p3-h83]|uniref:hypothetical protein n=1 Tax=Paracoccus sp. p3-h83 TaxID=3342805 RepID=UPI0035B912D9